MADFPLYIAEPTPVFLSASNSDFALVVLPRDTDAAPPVIDQIAPAVGATIGKSSALVFRLRDNTSFVLRELWIGFGAVPTSYDFVHDGTAFRGSYEAGSVATPVVGGWVFELRRSTGWPYGYQVRLRATVVDAGGNLVVINA